MPRRSKGEDLRLPLGGVGVETPVTEIQDAQGLETVGLSGALAGASALEAEEPVTYGRMVAGSGTDEVLVRLAVSMASDCEGASVRRTVSIPSEAVQALRVHAVVTGVSASRIAVEAVTKYLASIQRGDAVAGRAGSQGRRKPRAISRYSISAPGQWWRSLAVMAAATGSTQNEMIAISIASHVPAGPKVR